MKPNKKLKQKNIKSIIKDKSNGIKKNYQTKKFNHLLHDTIIECSLSDKLSNKPGNKFDINENF